MTKRLIRLWAERVERLRRLAQTLVEKDKEVEGLKGIIKANDKRIKDLEKVAKKHDREMTDIQEKLDSKSKRLEDVESGIKSREHSVKPREKSVKHKEEGFKAQPRKQAKESVIESGKELKVAKAQREQKLKDDKAKSERLEEQLQSANDNYHTLTLDYEATLADSEKPKTDNNTQPSQPDEALLARLQELEQDQNKYKSLLEKSRSNEQVVPENIVRAVQAEQVNKDKEFEEVRKALEAELQDTIQKLQDAEAKTTAAEIRAGETRTVLGMIYMEETIRELSRARLDSNEQLKSKDEDIAANDTELKSKDARIGRLEKLIADMTTIGLCARHDTE